MNGHFTRQHRLRSGEEFRRVFQGRCSVADGCLVVYAVANNLPYCRLGLSVSRKVGDSVTRNWWKRRIREAFRTQQSQWSPALDLVVLPRRDGAHDLEQIARSLSGLVKRLQRKHDSAGRREIPRRT